MFSTDQPKVAKIARSSTEGFAKVAGFAIASANQKFYSMGEICDSIAKDGADSVYLARHQREGLTQVLDYDPFIHHEITKWQGDPARWENVAFRRFLTIPGLGLVKAGFLIQLTLGRIGCLDTHNITKYGIKPSVVAWRKYYTWKHVDNYINTCRNLGGAEYLWNTWCAGIANRYPDKFASPSAVSSYHWEVLEC